MLHQKVGFEQVGVRRRLALTNHGFRGGQCCDVLLLDRRGDTIGT